MSLRRKSLEEQYLSGLEKKKKAHTSNPLMEKECSECGSKAMACFSNDFGETWFCYGHRPGATKEEYQAQTIKNVEVQKNIQERLSKRSKPKDPERVGRKSRFAPPKPIPDEEDYSWCF